MVALITIEVHARDVIEKLGKVGCTNANDFEWVSQLRFYWDREQNDCIVKQVGLRSATMHTLLPQRHNMCDYQLCLFNMCALLG